MDKSLRDFESFLQQEFLNIETDTQISIEKLMKWVEENCERQVEKTLSKISLYFTLNKKGAKRGSAITMVLMTLCFTLLFKQFQEKILENESGNSSEKSNGC